MLFVNPANAYFIHKSKFFLFDTEIKKYDFRFIVYNFSNSILKERNLKRTALKVEICLLPISKRVQV